MTDYFKWYNVELVSGEKFLGSPYMLPSGRNYDFWYIDYTTIKSRQIPVSQVKSMELVP
jgi:hypothetical protein